MTSDDSMEADVRSEVVELPATTLSLKDKATTLNKRGSCLLYTSGLRGHRGALPAAAFPPHLFAGGKPPRCRHLHGGGPVSYTHLDVYKRQPGKRCARRPYWCVPPRCCPSGRPAVPHPARRPRFEYGEMCIRDRIRSLPTAWGWTSGPRRGSCMPRP